MRLLLILLICFAFVGCNENRQDDWDESNMREFSEDDKEVNKAISITQDKLDYFNKFYFEHQADTSYRFFIKKEFIFNSKNEHMWSKLIEKNANIYLCVLDNVPIHTMSCNLHE